MMKAARGDAGLCQRFADIVERRQLVLADLRRFRNRGGGGIQPAQRDGGNGEHEQDDNPEADCEAGTNLEMFEHGSRVKRKNGRAFSLRLLFRNSAY
jgi:hypothetical protein